MIVELLGARGVGKSAVIELIRSRIRNVRSREGFRRIRNGMDLSDTESFIENERQYICREIADLKEYMRSRDIIFLARGPMDVLLYLDYSMNVAGYQDEDCNRVREALAEPIGELRVLLKHPMIYLTASDDVIRSRVARDMKRRSEVDRWLEYNRFAEARCREMSGIDFLETDNLAVPDVASRVLSLIADWKP